MEEWRMYHHQRHIHADRYSSYFFIPIPHSENLLIHAIIFHPAPHKKSGDPIECPVNAFKLRSMTTVRPADIAQT